MKVQFIYPNIVPYPKDICIGIAYLAAVLKRQHFDVSLIDTTFGMGDEEIISRVRRYNPDLIAISAVSNNFAYATHVAHLIKKITHTPIIIGGVHATVAPEETIREDCFDMICVGEGEDAFLELVQSMERGNKNTVISNIWFRDNGKIIRNPMRALHQDLDTLPFPDLSLFNYELYLKHHNGTASLLGSRGCPFKCSYCINHYLHKIYHDLGAMIRYRSVDNIITEIKKVIQEYRVEKIDFYDDTFTLSPKRVVAFCKKYRQEIGKPFSINARIDTITEEMCAGLVEAGCFRVSIGLESGDPDIRQRVLKKNITNDQIITGCSFFRKYGLPLSTYNIIGIPGEKMIHIHRTIELNRQVRPAFVQAFIFTAFKGTELYEECKRKNILDESNPLASLFNTTNVLHPDIPLKKLQHLRKWFGFKVFVAYDVKRALIDLFDRHFLMMRSYSMLRTMILGLLRRAGKRRLSGGVS
jgi:anaerobic magnesium-protoporphyrin IX monomethyl ester cyclase